MPQCGLERGPVCTQAGIVVASQQFATSCCGKEQKGQTCDGHGELQERKYPIPQFTRSQPAAIDHKVPRFVASSVSVCGESLCRQKINIKR